MRFFAIIAAAAAIKLTHKTHHRQEDATKPATDGEGKADTRPDRPAMSAGECRELSGMIDDMLQDAAGEGDNVITKAEALSAGASEEDWADAIATADDDNNGKLQKSEWGALKKSWMDDAGCSPKPKDGKKDGEGKGDKPATDPTTN